MQAASIRGRLQRMCDMLVSVMRGRGSAAEVVVVDRRRFYSEAVEHAVDGVAHRAGSAHIVFDILGIGMIFEIGVVDHLMDEARGIGNSDFIGDRIGTVERKMELEVGEFFFESEEVVEIEHFVERTGAVEVIHYAVGASERLGHVHDLRAQGCHAGATSDPHHFGL